MIDANKIMKKIINFGLVVALMSLGAFVVFSILSTVDTTIKENNVKYEKQLKDYNKEHKTSFKDLYDVVETSEYTTPLSVSEKTVKSGLFGSESLIKRVTFTKKNGDKITIDYDGDLPLGDYKSGKVVERYYPFRTRKTHYDFKEE